MSCSKHFYQPPWESKCFQTFDIHSHKSVQDDHLFRSNQGLTVSPISLGKVQRCYEPSFLLTIHPIYGSHELQKKIFRNDINRPSNGSGDPTKVHLLCSPSIYSPSVSANKVMVYASLKHTTPRFLKAKLNLNCPWKYKCSSCTVRTCSLLIQTAVLHGSSTSNPDFQFTPNWFQHFLTPELLATAGISK